MEAAATAGRERVVEATRAEQHLKKLLEEVKVKNACAMGIRNFLDKDLEEPRHYISVGKALDEAPQRISQDKAGLFVAVKEEYAMHGTAGILCYSIKDTDFMIACLWSIPFSEMLGNNSYWCGIMRRTEVNEGLFSELLRKAKRAGEDTEVTEEGVYLHAMMTKEARSMLLVDMKFSGEHRPLTTSEQLRAGEEVDAKLRQWLHQTESKVACSIGINNFTKKKLTGPQTYTDSGKCVYEFPAVIDPKMGGPALFTKRDLVPAGTAGICTYSISESDLKFAVMWSVPLLSTVVSFNYFNARIIPVGTQCDHNLFNSLKDTARQAKDGKLEVVEGEYKIEAEMGTEEHAPLIVNLRHHGGGSS